MPDTKERLIELFETVVSREELLCCGVVPVPTARVADHLIANGVTFATDNHVGSKWIPVKDRLPESGVRVIVCRGDKVEQGVFLGVNGWWKVYGTNTKAITHWMPMPEPPREEP